MRVFLSDGFDLLCGTARDASVELGDELGEVVSRVAAVSLQCRSLSPHVQQQEHQGTDKSSRHNCTQTHAHPQQIRACVLSIQLLLINA